MVELCPNCQKEVESGPYRICPSCNYYFPLTVQQRIALFADPGSFVEMATEMKSMNPISLAGYEDKLKENEKKSSLSDAVSIGSCSIENQPVIDRKSVV